MRKCSRKYPSYIFAIILFPCLISSSCVTFKEAPVENNFPERYTIDIPQNWSRSPKIIKAITDILPATTTELKDKQFCMNCTAGYTVKLIIEQPTIETYSSENNSQVTGFRYRSYFLVFNKKNEAVVKIIITDPQKDFFLWRSGSGSNYSTDYGYRPSSYSSKMLGKYDTYDMDSRRYTGDYNYTRNRSRGRSTPDKLDQSVLLNYTEKKLYAMRDMIKQWED